MSGKDLIDDNRIAIPLVLLAIVWNAYVLSMMWNWFLSPIFVVTLTTIKAIGISLTVRVLIGRYPDSNSITNISWNDVITEFSYPSIIFLVGWVLCKLMAMGLFFLEIKPNKI